MERGSNVVNLGLDGEGDGTAGNSASVSKYHARRLASARRDSSSDTDEASGMWDRMMVD